jgi:hypothetical protein
MGAISLGFFLSFFLVSTFGACTEMVLWQRLFRAERLSPQDGDLLANCERRSAAALLTGALTATAAGLLLCRRCGVVVTRHPALLSSLRSPSLSRSQSRDSARA